MPKNYLTSKRCYFCSHCKLNTERLIPYDESLVVLRICSPELSSCFVRLIRFCLPISTFSSNWKGELIHPTCSSSQVSKYCTIALISALSKVIESVLKTGRSENILSLQILSQIVSITFVRTTRLLIFFTLRLLVFRSSTFQWILCWGATLALSNTLEPF